MHDVVKLGDLPGLYFQEFASKAGSGVWYEAGPETHALIRLLAVHITVLTYHHLFMEKVNVTECTHITGKQGISWFAQRIKKFFNLQTGDSFNVPCKIIRIESGVELNFGTANLNTKLVNVFETGPLFKKIFPCYPTNRKTTFFKLSAKKRTAK